jgi:hypothetical protein
VAWTLPWAELSRKRGQISILDLPGRKLGLDEQEEQDEEIWSDKKKILKRIRPDEHEFLGGAFQRGRENSGGRLRVDQG